MGGKTDDFLSFVGVKTKKSAALAASATAFKQHNDRVYRGSERNGDRSANSAEPADQAYQRFRNKVWANVSDKEVRRLGPDSYEFRLIEYALRLSFWIHTEQLSKATQDMEGREEGLKRQCKELQERIEILTRNHGEEIGRKDAHYNFNLGQAEVKHQEVMNRVQQEHKEKVEEVVNNYKWHITKLKSEHTNKIAEFQGNLDDMTSAMQVMAEDHKLQIQELQSDYAVKVSELEQQSADQKTDHESTVAGIKQEHDQELIELGSIQEIEVAKLNAQHETNLEVLKKEIRGLRKVLLKRDNDSSLPSMLSLADIPQLPDERIKGKFSEIERLVDDLSRLVWTPDQRVWNDRILLKVGTKENQRLLKKHILQDSIWTLLHLHIFCSPFRMFGKEGESLESEWTHNFRADPRFDNGVYTWPALSIEAERWRYVTVRECRKALVEAIPSHLDPRAKIKKGFVTNTADLIKELKSLLDEMVEYTDADAKQIEQLVKGIANIWLEYGMHRCRFILFMGRTDSPPATEKARRAEEGNMELTILPGLKRYGDVTGVELTNATVVRGFEGEFFRLPL